jgi:hypothetical protein
VIKNQDLSTVARPRHSTSVKSDAIFASTFSSFIINVATCGCSSTLLGLAKT